MIFEKEYVMWWNNYGNYPHNSLHVHIRTGLYICSLIKPHIHCVFCILYTSQYTVQVQVSPVQVQVSPVQVQVSPGPGQSSPGPGPGQSSPGPGQSRSVQSSPVPGPYYKSISI